MWCLSRRYGPKIWFGKHHLSAWLGLKGDGSLSKSVHAHSMQEEFMALQIGDTAPDFEAHTTEGRIRFGRATDAERPGSRLAGPLCFSLWGLETGGGHNADLHEQLNACGRGDRPDRRSDPVRLGSGRFREVRWDLERASGVERRPMR